MRLNIDINKTVSLRKYLHQFPEISGKETHTSETIIDFIKRFKPDELIKAKKNKGFAFIYKGLNPGKTVLFRAELDALPIEEDGNFDYKSTKKKCFACLRT